MAKLTKSFVKGTKWLGRNVIPVLAYGYGAAAGLAANQAVRAVDKPGTPEAEPGAQMPDEMELRRSRRRQAAMRARTGRSSTVLADDSEDLL